MKREEAEELHDATIDSILDKISQAICAIRGGRLREARRILRRVRGPLMELKDPMRRPHLRGLKEWEY